MMRSVLFSLLILSSCGRAHREVVRQSDIAVRPSSEFCGNDCSVDSTCSEGTSCNKCINNRCTTEVPSPPPSPPMLAFVNSASECMNHCDSSQDCRNQGDFCTTCLGQVCQAIYP